MGTPIIAVACAKGGVAKTTTAMQVAGLLARWQWPVVLLDADNTGGATKWEQFVLAEAREIREENERNGTDREEPSLGFPIVPVNQPGLDRDQILERYPNHWVLIDTPPSDTTVIQKAIDAADVSIIPTQPSVQDLRLAGDTYAAARNGIVLLVRVKPRTRLFRQTVEELDSGNVTRFEHYISEREDIKAMAGTARLDLQEYSSVVDELVEFLKSVGVELPEGKGL